MLEALHRIERALPALLASRDGWDSLDVDYHPPRVERLYRTIGEHRVYLHVIHPCGLGDALFHPHPWPSAMRVLCGRYEMAVGWGEGATPPNVAATIVTEGPMTYEMTDPNGWHSVRTIGEPALTVMITGKPWDRWSPKSDAPLRPLGAARIDEILALFRAHYR